MKKFISLFTMLALLISICTAIPISVSAEDSTVVDLSQYLDNAKRYDDFKIPNESLSNLMDTPLTAKALTYADIEQYSWSSEYNESFFNDNFLLFIKWFEPVGVEPPIYSLSSMIRKGDTVEIELEGDAETLGPDVVGIYCVAIELPRNLCDLKYTAVYNKWIYIFTAQDLKDFADDVNSGNTYEGKTVVLDNDIDLSQICGEDINGETVSWTPIGMENMFEGTFNGNGHTISGLYINSEYMEFAGLFGGCDENSQILNLTVDGSVTVGCNDGGGGALPPFGLGGIAGASLGKIKNCHNKASITGIGNGAWAAGICGQYAADTENCINSGAVKSDDKAQAITDYGSCVNCYFLAGTSAECYGAEEKTAEQFASGEVAYLLGEAWGQEIGVDKYPVIGGKKVYLVNGKYTNNTPDLEITTVFCDAATNEVITEFKNNQTVHGIMTVTNKRDVVSYVSFSYAMIKDGKNIEPPNVTAPISIESGADYQYDITIDGSLCDTFVLSAADYTGESPNPVLYNAAISKAPSVEPTPPVKEVTVDPPTVNVPSGTVPIGTTVTISSTDSHIAYSINGSEWQYEYFTKTITITENTTLTVKSWVDALEEGTTYITPEAVYTYTVNNSVKYPYEITLLRFTDINGNEIIAPEQGKSFIVEADIVKKEERNEKDYLFVAVYNEGGALMSLDYVKANFPLNSECSFGFNIPAQDKVVGSVKAFVWNTFNSAQPLAEGKILAPVIFE